MVKTKLKYVIPTFFTCFVQMLTARTERNSCWAMRNLVYLGHLFERQGDREGGANGDLCLSCIRHLPLLPKTIKAP
jgi:hypothetical protein